MSAHPAGPRSTPSRPVRVALVDDSRVVRSLVRRIVEAQPDMVVVWEAGDGREALARTTGSGERPAPDVILLDLRMPGLDGLGTLDELRRVGSRARVIMLSALTRRGGRETLEALSRGAVDYVCKPSAADGRIEERFAAELLGKIRAWARFAGGVNGGPALRFAKAPAGPEPRGAAVEGLGVPRAGAVRDLRRPGPPVAVVGIAASTGGPQALATVLSGLPRPLRVPVLITQHMPEGFTAALASQLVRATGHACEEARPGVVPQPGHAYVAPGGRHLVVEGRGQPRLRLDDSAPRNFCRPAADPMFESMADVFGAAAVAVVLTGMGCDGADGARRIAAGGGVVLVQDEASSVVWGMPAAVVRAGAATAVLPLPEIARAIAGMVEGGRQ